MRRFRTPALAVAAVALLGAGLTNLALARGGTDTTPQGWTIAPAGQQVDVMRFPLGLVATPDQSKVIVTSNSGGPQWLTTIDANNLTSVPSINANLFMGVAATPDGRVFASGGNADRVFRFRMVGPTVVSVDPTETQPVPAHHILDTATQGQNLPAGDGIRVPGYPGNMLLDGNLLYVAGTLGEPAGSPNECPGAQPACSRVTIIDTSADNGMGAVVGRAPVGLDAYALAIDPGRHLLYVSNWADESGRGGDSGGTVSIVDVSDPANAHEINAVQVGHHPEAIQLSGDRTHLFVTNTNDDTISVIDVQNPLAPGVTTESVGVAGTPVGAHPDALALSPDGSTLFVALAGINAVELRDGKTGAPVAGHSVYIPTGWYPAALVVTGDSQHYRLWVANQKGSGFGTGYNGSVLGDGSKPDSVPGAVQAGGSVSAIDLPAKNAKQLDKWTSAVAANDKFENADIDVCKDAPNLGMHRVSQVLCPPSGQASPIKHVLYIVTENKTFDQYFGDINATGKFKGYDADPSYALYGQPFTPNHHALADRYSMGDRFYSDAEVSVTGHSWTAGAIATDHNEKTFQADYDQGIRGTHGGGDPLRPSVGTKQENDAIAKADDELQDPEGGYIFEAFKKNGAQPPTAGDVPPSSLTMAIYGERELGNPSQLSSPFQAKGPDKTGKVRVWKDGDIQYFDTCRANEFVTGNASDGPAPDNQDQFGDCSGRTLDPQFNLAHWNDVFQRTGNDVMPNFMYMSLPDNHTLGTNLGSPTPASMVADNDYAIGKIVEALSKSPFWGSTAIIQTEDDTQAAGDHVSPLRDYIQVTSPWAAPGPQHQRGSMPALLRTIEQIFGVQPIALTDKLAVPLHDAFLPLLTDKPDTGPYTAIKPIVPFAINQPGAPDQALSQAQDWSQVDRVPMDVLNKIQYEAQGKAPPG